jgi:hypothetical protein
LLLLENLVHAKLTQVLTADAFVLRLFILLFLVLLFRLEIFLFLFHDIFDLSPIGLPVLPSLIYGFVQTVAVRIDCEALIICEKASITIGYGFGDGRIDSWDLKVRIGRRGAITLHIDDPGRWRVVWDA